MDDFVSEYIYTVEERKAREQSPCFQLRTSEFDQHVNPGFAIHGYLWRICWVHHVLHILMGVS